MKRPGNLMIFLAFCMFSPFYHGCGTDEEKPKEPVLAVVGGEPITNKDIGVEYADFENRRRSAGRMEIIREDLDRAIERKALLQQANKAGLQKGPEFTRDIELYKEQLLIKLLLDKEKNELERTITATEEEVELYSRIMLHRLRFLKKQFPRKDRADVFLAMASSGQDEPETWDSEASITLCRGLGPIFALELYSMKPGQAKVIKRGDQFMVVKMLENRKTASVSQLPPRGEIKKRLLSLKRAEALEDWIALTIQSAGVEISEGAIRELAGK